MDLSMGASEEFSVAQESQVRSQAQQLNRRHSILRPTKLKSTHV